MSNFETWWEREGQEFLYALNTTTDDDIKLVAEVAWKNGAHCAEQAEQEPVAIDWEPLQNFWRNNSSIDWEELESAVKCAVATTVRTKDLTDDEIEKAIVHRTVNWLTNARAVIAADRRKNNANNNT